jgi:hypothetical protein
MRFKQPRCIAWFNPENPQFCGVTDLTGDNPIVVKLETDVPPHDAPTELLRQANSENAAMERHAKEVYRVVKMTCAKEFAPRRFRANTTDGAAAEITTEFRRQSEAITAETTKAMRQNQRNQRMANALGTRVSSRPKRVERVHDGLEWEKQIRSELAGETSSGKGSH